MADLLKLTPPKEMSAQDKINLFQHIFRRLAAYRNKFELYIRAEYAYRGDSESIDEKQLADFQHHLNDWAQTLAESAWIACQGPETLGKSVNLRNATTSKFDTKQ